MNRRIKTKRRQNRKVTIKQKFKHNIKPRVFVFKSNKYLYCGVANDQEQKVLASVKVEKGKKNIEKLVKEMAKKIQDLGISEVVFDRSGYKYHGNVKELADGLRAAGLKL